MAAGIDVATDFNRFVKLEGHKPVVDLEEAYIMYVALTRARKKLLLSTACAEIISASAAAKAGRARGQKLSDDESSAELHRSRIYRNSPQTAM
jgi:superfamily I DNA/RNA helicase